MTMASSSGSPGQGFFSGRVVLVTGAGGFIGSHLTEALVNQGAQVRVMVKYNSRNDWGNLELLPDAVKGAVEVFSGDIADPFFVRKAVSGCDTVFHLAALIGIPYSYVAPQHYIQVNIQGTLNVLEACRAEGVRRLIHTSTSETYGTALYTPIDEKHPLQGQSPYSASKIGADKMAESYFRSFDLPVAVIRPFNAYGPRQSARAIIPTIISQALEKREIHIGSLSPVRDFTFVRDTARGFLAMAACDEAIGQVVNVGSGRCVSMQDVLDEILDLLGMPHIPVHTDTQRIRPDKSEVQVLLCDNRKAQSLLGWTPDVSLRDGLSQTIEAVQAMLTRYKTAVYNV